MARHSLDDAVLRIDPEVAVVLPHVGEVHPEGAECPEGLQVFSPQDLGHVEAVHHLALPPLLRLLDAVQKLDLMGSEAQTRTPSDGVVTTMLHTVPSSLQRR